MSMKKVYEAVLHIDPLQKDSTNVYICRKTFETKPEASVYIYAVGKITSYFNKLIYAASRKYKEIVKYEYASSYKVTAKPHLSTKVATCK